jgi:hypothetical protein
VVVCFSAQADLVGGVVLGAIGIDTLRHVGPRREYLPLAALPLMFAGHQLVEAVVWWGLQGHLSATAADIATWLYLLFAFVVLPVYVPVAVFVAEPSGQRRQLIRWSIVVGGIVSALLLAAMVRGPVTASLDDWHIRYGTGIDAAVPTVGAYLVATCGSLLLSTNRVLVRFGVVNLVAVAVIALFVVEGFASLWCAWAALASGAVALHLRREGSAADAQINQAV